MNCRNSFLATCRKRNGIFLLLSKLLKTAHLLTGFSDKNVIKYSKCQFREKSDKDQITGARLMAGVKPTPKRPRFD